MKKVYSVQIERTIIVMAETKEEAVEVAEDFEHEEIHNGPDYIDATEIETLGKIPHEWRDAIPYGGDGDRRLNDILK